MGVSIASITALGLSSMTRTLALMLGLAVGIDYALFIVSRYREERTRGCLSAPGVARTVLGAGLYLAVIGLLGVVCGAMLRNTAGAIAAVIGLALFVPLLSSLLGSWFSAHIGPYLPSNAGEALLHVHRQADMLSPWAGFAVAALAAAAFVLRRRDA